MYIFDFVDFTNLVDALTFLIFLPLFLYTIRNFFNKFENSYKNYFYRNGIPWFLTFLVREYVKNIIL